MKHRLLEQGLMSGSCIRRKPWKQSTEPNVQSRRSKK
nr:MAG TPA: hypothetical protein [Caudoviricetes sp.]